jgi:adenosylcobinamide-phosphate synthase
MTGPALGLSQVAAWLRQQWITLGGPARYGGRWHNRPRLGCGAAPRAGDIARALGLVRGALGLWLTLLLSVALLSHA